MSAIVLLLIFSMLTVVWLDGTRYIIPNWLVGLLLISYPAALMMVHRNIDWKLSIAGAVIVLVVGYIIFIKRMMGGGDIKLLTACSLWVGLDNLADFLIAVSLIGGVFAVVVWVIRKGLPRLPKQLDKAILPRILRDGEPLPYGVAIAIGFLWMMWTGSVTAIL